MSIRNRHDLQRKIEELTHKRNKYRESFLTTSDHTRDVAGSVQQGMYLGQMALSAFRNLTNYHISPKKRVLRVALSIGIVVALNFLRKKLVKKSS